MQSPYVVQRKHSQTKGQMAQSEIPATTWKIQAIRKGYATQDGAGVKLTRILDPRQATLTDPFLLFDEFRSDQAGDYIEGFPPHPHRGFETVTYMIAGRMRHRDSRGNQGDLGPGSIQWMTAGRGLVHEEMPQQEQGLMWGYQLWVNLPASDKMCEPAYQDIPAERIPEAALPGGGKARVLCGDLLGTIGPVALRPTSPAYFDLQLGAGEHLAWDAGTGRSQLLYGIKGSFFAPGETRPIEPKEIAILTGEGKIEIRAGQQGARLLAISGRKLGEPIAHYGPFVMNSREEINRAVEDYQAGRLG
jgi:redox-sensitive bicupin YhaK (pirin superfamily)